MRSKVSVPQSNDDDDDDDVVVAVSFSLRALMNQVASQLRRDRNSSSNP